MSCDFTFPVPLIQCAVYVFYFKCAVCDSLAMYRNDYIRPVGSGGQDQLAAFLPKVWCQPASAFRSTAESPVCAKWGWRRPNHGRVPPPSPKEVCRLCPSHVRRPNSALAVASTRMQPAAVSPMRHCGSGPHSWSRRTQGVPFLFLL